MLTLTQLLRQPMLFLPRSLSATADARNALARLSPIFHAEVVADVAFTIEPTQNLALQVKDATFEWEGLPSPNVANGHGQTPAAIETSDRPFQVQNINMSIPRGNLIAVVGRVGSGKVLALVSCGQQSRLIEPQSSLLQGIIGEMRKLRGEFSFGGRVAYCPQTAWIQNATVVHGFVSVNLVID